MKPIRELPRGPREAREIGREAQANEQTFEECKEDIAFYYDKPWSQMSDAEKAEALMEFRNGKKEEREANA